MQSDLGKLFIGGVSWDTNEEDLKDYFSRYGEVVDAVIMKDRTTGRARGFGFVVFADPTIADRVVKEKHTIDGRMVEAKKAVPRDDQSILSRSCNSIPGSPNAGQSRKIFVGGLASTVTEEDFRLYFEQFGTITDVVVMYDHKTQRPRGFGFITYDSVEAVDKVLLKTFHELNGKMVEVKRAIPKESSPSPVRSPLSGYNYSPSRVNNFLNGFPQGYAPSGVGSFGLRMDGRFTGGTRSGFSPFGPGYGMGMNFESGLGAANYGGTPNLNANLGYGRVLSPYFIGNSSRFSSPGGYDRGNNRGSNSLFSSSTHSLWGNGGLGSFANSPNLGSSSGNADEGTFGNYGVNWGGAAISSQDRVNIPSQGRNNPYRIQDNQYSLSTGIYGRNNITQTSSSNGLGGTFSDFYDGPAPFDFSSEISSQTSGYMGDYGADKREDMVFK